MDETSSISIRAAQAGDAERVFQLIQPFVASRLLLPRTVDEIRDLTECGLCAEHASVVVGFASIEIYSKKLAEIHCLAVASEHQASGVGRRLVAGCVELARQHGVRELMAISSSDEFLKQCGFDYSLPDQKRALFINP